MSFSSDSSQFAIGTSFGLKIFNTEPLKLLYRFVPEIEDGMNTGKDIGIVGFISDNVVAFVGKGKNPIFGDSKIFSLKL